MTVTPKSLSLSSLSLALLASSSSVLASAPVNAPVAATPITTAPAIAAPKPVSAAAQSAAQPGHAPAQHSAQAPSTQQVAHDSHQAHALVESVSAEVALGWLKNGNTRFIKQRTLRKDGASSADRTRLVKGQRPHTIVVSCSDSRVPPEVVFDQKLGEIFVIRTAGEVLDSGAIASIEYAVEHLGTKLVLVMGHESCGAVKAAIEAKAGQSAGSLHLDKLVADIKPRIQASLRGPASQGVLVESSMNAKGAAADLLKRSEIVRKKVESGGVSVRSALYHLQSGRVDFLNP